MEPSERDAWVGDAERWICQIHGVLQCKIDLDQDGNVSGVHVVAGMERQPRHVVRDVESLLKARLGISVFYKKIGVVQVLDNGAAEPAFPEEEPYDDLPIFTSVPGQTAAAGAEPVPAVLLEEIRAPRLQCTGVGLMASDLTVRAEVELSAGGIETRGVVEGPNHAGIENQLLGKAAVAAVRQLIDEPVILDLAEIRQEQVAGQGVFLAAVDLVEGRRTERLFGSCGTLPNRQQAVVYAVLDALNRRLSLMALKSREVEAEAQSTP